MITSNNLTPNQYYLLQCFYDAYTPTEINIDAELKELVNKGYVSIVGNIGAVTNKGKALVNKIEKLFNAPVVAEVLDDDYEKNMRSI
jgi:coproporphyrinogen III oxidase-like Fe-S oxidoreductase